MFNNISKLNLNSKYPTYNIPTINFANVIVNFKILFGVLQIYCFIIFYWNFLILKKFKLRLFQLKKTREKKNFTLAILTFVVF